MTSETFCKDNKSSMMQWGLWQNKHCSITSVSKYDYFFLSEAIPKSWKYHVEINLREAMPTAHSSLL